MSSFKAGDRVVYDKGSMNEDHGTILRPKSTEGYGDNPDDRYWARWDSNSQEEHCSVKHLELEVQSSIDLESKLRSWILKEKPTTDHIQGACEFIKFIKE